MTTGTLHREYAKTSLAAALHASCFMLNVTMRVKPSPINKYADDILDLVRKKTGEAEIDTDLYPIFVSSATLTLFPPPLPPATLSAPCDTKVTADTILKQEL